jgi:hypothetical protein
MLQKIAGALNQKVEIKFSAIASWDEFGVATQEYDFVKSILQK